jgi:ABC-2 type transport system permease protein
MTPSTQGRFPVFRLSARRTLRSAVLWGYVFGVTIASSALTYSRIYKTPEERRQLAASFGANHTSAALFGPAPQLQTVAGFTVLKASMTLMIIGAVWGLLTSTRLLRGEEDAGRWEMLLSGAATKGGAVVQALGGLGAGVAVLWAITGLITVLAGRVSSVHIDVTAGLYFALAMVSSALVFMMVGAVTSQIAPSRRQAAGIAAGVLGLSYGLRMVGDAGSGAHWLVWASPLGWVEELRPLTDPQPWALLPILLAAAVLALCAVWLAERRDVGAGLLPDRVTSAPRLRLLGGPTGLTLRLTSSSVIWWTVSTAIAGLLMGIMAKSAGSTISGSSIRQVFSRLGALGTGAATFLGVAFLMIAIVLCFQAASLIGAARAEEAEGRLDHLLVRAVGRTRWYVGRLGLATLAIAISGIAAGLFTWVGTATEASGVHVSTAVEAGVNIIPPALFLLGVGALGLGAWPRRAAAVVYVALGWSALVDLLGGFSAQNRWVLDTSLFHQMASAPAVAPDWQTNGVLIGVGLLAMVVGALCLHRRDLVGE